MYYIASAVPTIRFIQDMISNKELIFAGHVTLNLDLLTSFNSDVIIVQFKSYGFGEKSIYMYAKIV